MMNIPSIHTKVAVSIVPTVMCMAVYGENLAEKIIIKKDAVAV